MSRRYKLIIIAFLISFLAFIVENLHIPAFENLNSFFYSLKFKLRGKQTVDSTIVFLYIDDPAIHSLGGYPIKRTYYALLIDMLTQLNVKAIAFDILLTEKNYDYPERDNLLVSMTKKSQRVYFGGNFTSLGNFKVDSVSDILQRFTFKLSDPELNFPTGLNFSKPFDELLKNCSSIGHLNYISRGFPSEIPMLILIGKDQLLPSLSLELARVYFDIPRDSVKISKDKIQLGKIRIPLKNGKLLINYAGGTNSLWAYSVLDFIKSYDSLKAQDKFKNKIVLIGIFSEALRQVIQTPFDDRFPPTGIHIMALNTIAREKFLSELGTIFNFLFSFILSSLLLHIILFQKAPNIFRFFIFPVLIISSVFLIIILLFAFGISISIYPILTLILSAFIGVIYTFELEHRKVIEIERERKRIEELMREKELKIIELQKEIENLKIAEEKVKMFSSLEQAYDEMRELASRFDDLSEFTSEESQGINFEGVVYASKGKMEKVISIVKKVAPSNAPVLITGENGVGKELIAMAIHKLSERKDKKFVAINCSAIPETLLESELFGYEKGAFTGATQRKKGLFESADGGTIFLDEIAETSDAFQTKILRILQSGEFNRVGGTETLKVDVRIIAATNRDIEKAVKEGKFREDLYYRLNVVQINIPPLRERKEDIPFLVKHFLKKFKSDDVKISQAVMLAFLNYEWPGNVRQLENAIKRALIFARSDGRNLIQLKDLPEEIAKSIRGKIDIEEKILNLLREKKFSYSSISETANELGLNRGTVAEYLRGICFKSLYECKFDINLAALKIAGGENEFTERAKKKIIEYIDNFIENIKQQYKSTDEIKSLIKSKYKNLPIRYHFYLEEFILKFQRGEISREKLLNY